MDILEVIAALDALAQKSRLDIFRLLIKIAPQGMMVSEIAASLNMPLTTLSFHLDKLKRTGLIINKREGRASLYSANYIRLDETIRFLTENCCQDSDDITCKTTIKN